MTRKPGKRKYWTDADREYLKLHYPDADLKDLCVRFGVSEKSIYQQAYALGLKRSDEALEIQYKNNVKRFRENGNASWFLKGHVPSNKGKKQTEYMSADAIERTKSTRMKPGNRPGNAVPVGTERITGGYVFVKIQDGAKAKNWKLKHRIIYEQHFGSVPDGFIVEFADGNTSNFEVVNLIVKKRSENVQDNRLKDGAVIKRFFKIKDPAEIENFIQNYPELIELKRNELKLNGKLRQLKKSLAGPGG